MKKAESILLYLAILVFGQTEVIYAEPHESEAGSSRGRAEAVTRPKLQRACTDAGGHTHLLYPQGNGTAFQAAYSCHMDADDRDDWAKMDSNTVWKQRELGQKTQMLQKFLEHPNIDLPRDTTHRLDLAGFYCNHQKVGGTIQRMSQGHGANKREFRVCQFKDGSFMEINTFFAGPKEQRNEQWLNTLLSSTSSGKPLSPDSSVVANLFLDLSSQIKGAMKKAGLEKSFIGKGTVRNDSTDGTSNIVYEFQLMWRVSPHLPATHPVGLLTIRRSQVVYPGSPVNYDVEARKYRE